MKIMCGVPQGSISGPLLFILYINDIVKVPTVLNPVLCADDTSLFHTHTDFDTLIEEINGELQKNNNLVPYQHTFSKYKKNQMSYYSCQKVNNTKQITLK